MKGGITGAVTGALTGGLGKFEKIADAASKMTKIEKAAEAAKLLGLPKKRRKQVLLHRNGIR